MHGTMNIKKKIVTFKFYNQTVPAFCSHNVRSTSCSHNVCSTFCSHNVHSTCSVPLILVHFI